MQGYLSINNTDKYSTKEGEVAILSTILFPTLYRYIDMQLPNIVRFVYFAERVERKALSWKWFQVSQPIIYLSLQYLKSDCKRNEIKSRSKFIEMWEICSLFFF